MKQVLERDGGEAHTLVKHLIALNSTVPRVTFTFVHFTTIKKWGKCIIVFLSSTWLCLMTFRIAKTKGKCEMSNFRRKRIKQTHKKGRREMQENISSLVCRCVWTPVAKKKEKFLGFNSFTTGNISGKATTIS